MDVADTILSKNPDPDIEHLLALAAATAHYYRGDFDRAEDYIRDYDLDADLEGTLLSARISWDRRPAASRHFQAGDLHRQIPQQRARLRAAKPLLPGHGRARQGPPLCGSAQYQRTVERHPPHRPALQPGQHRQAGACRQGSRGHPQAVWRRRESPHRPWPTTPPTPAGWTSRAVFTRRPSKTISTSLPSRCFWSRAHITSGDYQGAIDFTEELAKEKPEWMDRNMGVFNSLRSVAYHGVGNKDYSDIYLEAVPQAG